MKNVKFQVGDICQFLNPDTEDQEVLSFEVLGEEDAENAELEIGGSAVLQVLTVKYLVQNGRVGVALVTELGCIEMLLPGCSSVSFGDITSLVRNGEQVS